MTKQDQLWLDGVPRPAVNHLGEPLNERGNKVRRDGGGDPWADEHRTKLDKCYMADVDYIVSLTLTGVDSEDKSFHEFATKRGSFKPSRKRKHATVAIFDRAATKEIALGDKKAFTLSQHLDLCERLGEVQPVAPKFFFVCGHRNAPSWLVIEMDIYTGEELQERTLSSTDWEQDWRELGLLKQRATLQNWLDKK